MMIYLDNNATTFLDPLVLEAMEPVLSGKIGNPSSIHRYGQAAQALLARATKEVAAYFGVQTSEVVFTSGATEALNMILRSIPKGSHIITSSVEHIAVMESIKLTECEITYLDPKPGAGAICVQQIQEVTREDTAMIVVLAANNETGIMTDLEPIAAFAKEQGICLVVDAVALLGKEEFVFHDGISAVCFSGHKIHGPTGVGVTLIRNTMKCPPLIVGGPQQYNRRGGTENLAGIVGFAKALTLLPKSNEQIEAFRDYFEKEITSQLSDVIIHGIDQDRICNTSNMAFLGVDGETLLMQLDLAGVAVSHGSACSSGTLETSRVLLNMGIASDIARSSLRFSLSRFTTKEEIDRTISIIIELVSKLRALIQPAKG